MNINIPTPLRAYTGQQAVVQAEGATVSSVLKELVTLHPDLEKNLYGTDGKLRSFVNVYLNEDDIRYLPNAEESLVKPTDELSIIPSIAGGR